MEFSDFQCPYCIAAPEIDALLKGYPQQVRLIFKEFPLESHSHAFTPPQPRSPPISKANSGRCTMPCSPAAIPSNPSLIEIAKTAGLDMPRFEKDMDSKEVRDAIAKDVAGRR